MSLSVALLLSVFGFIRRRPSRYTLFPYTTLFRSGKVKPKDKSLEEAIISDEENEPLDLIYGNQKFNPKTGMYQTMKKGGQVKKRNNFSGRGAGRALRGF